MKTVAVSAFFIFVSAFFSVPPAAQSLKAEEIVAKHLDSIGTKAKRDELKTLMALGYSEFESRFPIVKGGGRAIVVSDPKNLFFVITLNSREYPFEKIGYFNGKANLPFIAPGARSLLGLFIAEHEKILSEGLFGGSMSLRWPFFAAEKKLWIKASGTKKIDGRKMLAIEYVPSSGASNEFRIKLFFDADTFNHVRSEYHREVVSGRVIFGQANQHANAVLTLTEEFSDFKTIDGFTLPHAYKVIFLSNSNTSANENRWGINVAEYRVNQKLLPDFFTFDTK